MRYLLANKTVEDNGCSKFADCISSKLLLFIIASVLGGLLLVSCSRTESGASHPEEKSVEQRITELEQYQNGNAARISDAELQKQHERALAEIQSMGLVERAQHDFITRLTNATVETWSIGYVINTNTVWCDVRYRLPNGSETLQKEFGYSRKTGTNWSLIWEVGARPQ